MKVKVLLVMPGMEVQKVRIPASIKFLKSIIGEELMKITVNENVAIFVSKNTNIEDFNRFYKGNIIMGNFAVVGIKKNKIVSLKKRAIKRYSNLFELSRHQRKIDLYKEEFLEKYYTKQANLKRKANKENKQRIFGIAA